MDKKIYEYRSNPEKAAEYFAKDLAFTLGPVELKNLMDDQQVRIIDVRDREDYDIAHIPSAISIPEKELTDKLSELSKDEVNVVYCYNILCHLGAKAAFKLANAGHSVVLLEGGFKSWTEDFRFATSI